MTGRPEDVSGDLDYDCLEAARRYCKDHTDFLPGHHLVTAIVEGFLLAKAERGRMLFEVEEDENGG